MSKYLKLEKKSEGASSYRAWKKRIDFIFEKNKVLNLVKAKVKKPTNESSDAEKEKFRETKILAMTLMVDGIKDNLIQYITNIHSAQEIWKDTPIFENACSQEEVRISLVRDKESEEEKISNSSSTHQKNKGTFNKFIGPRKNIDIFKIKCYNCHHMGHYRSNCPKNPRNKRRYRDQANNANEGSPKKNTMEGFEVKDMFSKDS